MNIFIGCSKTKLDHPAKAKDIYTDASFRYAWGYAEGLKKDHDNIHIYILSAKHHLLNPDKEISPYNEFLGDFSADEKKKWAEECISAMKASHINFDEEAIFLCGSDYLENLIGEFSRSKTPLKNLQIGKRLKKIKNMCLRVNPGYKISESLADFILMNIYEKD
jgi:hypothetical protein